MLDLHLVYSKLNSPPASCGISDIHVTYSTETSSSTVGAMFSQLESSMVTVTASAVIAAVYVQKKEYFNEGTFTQNYFLTSCDTASDTSMM
jgi:hypothetical protein